MFSTIQTPLNGQDRLYRVTFQKNVRYTGKLQANDVTLEQLFDLVSNPKELKSKTDAPLIKLSEFGPKRSNSKQKSYRHDGNSVSIYGVEGDIDNGTVSFDDAVTWLRESGVTGIVLTSPSFTPEFPKLRILCPLQDGPFPASREKFHELVGKLNHVMRGNLSTESFTLSQFYYYHTADRSTFRAELAQGESLNALAVKPLLKAGGSDVITRSLVADPRTEENPIISAAFEKGLNPEYQGNGIWYLDCPWAEEHTHADKRGDAKFFLANYNGYAGAAFFCQHGHCRNRTIRDLREFLGIPEPDPFSDFSEGGISDTVVTEKPSLEEYDICPRIDDLSSKLSSLEYVLDKYAVVGELTVFWAKHGSGKTLLVIRMLIDSAKAGRLDGKKVFYINADDSAAGAKQKAEICAQYGIMMQVPGLYGFSNKKFFEFVDNSIAYGDARGYVLILDTLKKFVNIMDKKECSELMTRMRNFCKVGGTVIMLSHTNKNPQADGNPIYGGVSDVSDDSDSFSYIVTSGSGLGDMTAKLYSDKKRLGDGGLTFFRFNGGLTGEDRTYQNLLNSVQEISIEQGELDQKALERRKKADTDDSEVISVIREVIRERGSQGQEAIVKSVREVLNVSIRRVRGVLHNYLGDGSGDLQYWRAETGTSGRQEYKLNETDDIFPETIKEETGEWL